MKKRELIICLFILCIFSTGCDKKQQIEVNQEVAHSEEGVTSGIEEGNSTGISGELDPYATEML